MDASRNLERTQRAVAQACQQASTPTGLLSAVQQALDRAVPADRWCAMTLDPATTLPTGGIHDHGLSAQYAPRMLELEFAGGDVNGLTDLARGPQAVATLDAATQGDKARSARYREVLQPDGVAHELRAVFRDSNGPWAAMILFRSAGKGQHADFTAQDIAIVDGIAEQLTRALRRVLLLGEIEAQAGAHQAPALLLLEGTTAMRVRHASQSAPHWLEQIDDGTAGELPYALASLAQRARGAGHAMARLRTRAGRWLTAHAEAVQGTHEVSLILQPSRPHEIANVLAGAYALTAREAEVARLIAAGCSNTEAAKLLFVSRYTVEDHLKNIYGKLGVNSRSELVSRLFFDQYLPRTRERLGLDGDGWFMRSA
ncbi:MAG TPA: helix-turn-helix transcriptional regulator [Ramlibacter sp.]|nr:helix-turn-helix transcriptional regulator [Ramlibacter sp.]